MVQEVVHGYQAKLASQGQSTKTRHPGGRGGGKRGGKVLALPPQNVREPSACAYLFQSLTSCSQCT